MRSVPSGTSTDRLAARQLRYSVADHRLMRHRKVDELTAAGLGGLQSTVQVK